MSTEKNIWDKEGCEDLAGKMCGACCIFYTITGSLLGATEAFFKDPGEACEYLDAGHGCSCHELRPGVCKNYFCGQINDPLRRAQLIKVWYQAGQVEKQNALEAIQKQPHFDSLQPRDWEEWLDEK